MTRGNQLNDIIAWLDRECPPGTAAHDLSHDFAERLRERLDSLVNTNQMSIEKELVESDPRSISLWLDDIRPPADYGRIGYTWAKTYDEAIELLKTGRVIRASLDHDLTIEQTMGKFDGKPTGFDVLIWMRDNNAWPAGGVQVHSLNPEGRRRMEEFIRQHAPQKAKRLT